MLATRHEFQPSMNFFAPISMSMVVAGRPMASNSEPLTTSSSNVIPQSSAAASFLKAAASPT